MTAAHSENMVRRITDPAAKIAPVFDTTGSVVSDPSGAIMGVNIP
jgi:hypothetical protein